MQFQKGRNLKCDHCRYTNHSLDHCWVKFGKSDQANTVTEAAPSTHTEVADTVIITQVKYDRILQTVTATPVAIYSTPSGTQTLFTTFGEDWVVNLGVSKHMCCTRNVSSTLSSSVSTPFVTVANGTCSPVRGQGNVSLPNNLTLCDVLYVPNFPVNLLSVSQLTKNHHCAVTLFPTYLLIQDQETN